MKNKRNTIKNVYEKDVNLFDDFSRKSFSWNYLEKPLLDKHLSLFYNSKTKILDAGCGSGRIISHLLKKGILPKNIIGVDFSKKMLAIAKEHIPNVRFIHANIDDSISTNDQFDVITCSMVIQDLNDKQLKKALKNFKKILKVNGLLFLIVSHPLRVIDGNVEEYFDTGMRTLKNPWGTEMECFHRTVSDYINHIIDSGFRIMAVDEPMIPKEAKTESEYPRYAQTPVRLAIKVVKLDE